MIQLSVLSGQFAGTTTVARRFPFYVGRDPSDDLCLPDAGVWGRHVALELEPGGAVRLAPSPEAGLTVNGERFDGGPLRNGDVIEIGALKLRFLLAPARQRTFHWREAATWLALGLLVCCQIGMIAWLLR